MSGMSKSDYVRYWNGLVTIMRAQNFLPDDWDRAISDTTRQRIYTFPATGDEVRISAGASPGIASESPYIQVYLTANPNADAKAIFMSLYQQRGIISNEINSDPPVRWEIRGEKEESWARTRRYAVPQEEGSWRTQYEWLAPTLFAFNEVPNTALKMVACNCRDQFRKDRAAFAAQNRSRGKGIRDESSNLRLFSKLNSNEIDPD